MYQDYTIAETYTLPSMGRIYETPINPDIKLRSMTTAEEMRRLAHTEEPYKLMSDIIEACIIGTAPMRVYDMCLGDYQFLLHKLRVVTYGPEYKMLIRCPKCGKLSDTSCDLDKIEVKTYNPDTLTTEVRLPRTQKVVKIRYQTPRMLDKIAKRKKELLKKAPNYPGDPELAITLEHMIESVDGQHLDTTRMETFVRNLPMMDTNVILKAADRLNREVGLDDAVECTCGQCGAEVKTTFRFTSEFFGPSVD